MKQEDYNRPIKLKDKLNLYFRAISFYLFYEFRFFPYLTYLKITNPWPIVSIRIREVIYKMKLDIKDEGLSRDLIINKIREFPNVFYFKKYLQDNLSNIDTIFDVGANIGYYAMLSSSVIKNKKNKRLIAIEPVQKNYNLLKENFSLNKFTNKKFDVIRAALGDIDKETYMIVPSGRNLSHVSDIRSINSIKNFSEEKVHQYSLKSIMEKYKIKNSNILFRWDVEGYEYNIISGNKDIFSQIKNAHIVMEFHPFLIGRSKSIEMMTILMNSGFKLKMVTSCFPLYILKTPSFLRSLIIKSFINQKNASFGIVKKFKSIDDVIQSLENESDPIYGSYPNIHLYLKK